MKGRIVVAGGANIDIIGWADSSLLDHDSNPGSIRMEFGGVGRNIAQICALLGKPVSLVTCFSADDFGQRMKEDCRQLGIDCAQSFTFSDVQSSVYMAILDEKRDMRLALNDMHILQKMTPALLENIPHSLQQNDILAADANLEADSIRFLLENCSCMKAADPVSVSKCGKFIPVLDRLDIFKPNRYEAERISGIRPADENSAAACLEWFRRQGVRETVISLGKEGILLGTQDYKVHLRHETVNVHNATGAGDAFLGAYMAARLDGREALEAAGDGICAAVLTIENDAVRRRKLCSSMIEEKRNSLKIEEVRLCG